MSQPDTTKTPRQQQDIDLELKEGILDTLGSLNVAIGSLALTKDSERFWGTIKRLALVLAIVGSIALYAVTYGRAFGVQTDPSGKAVALVPIIGTIGPGLDASAEQVVPIIERACRSKNVEIVALEINSGGGAPSEAERIMAAIDRCRAGTDDSPGKPVYALINGMGASAAYMIAMRAERVYAGRYSLVGSIGAIIRINDASELAQRVGVREAAYRTAPLKGGPSVLGGSTELEDQAYQELVSEVGQVFLEDVLATRGEKITLGRDELYSGRLWTAGNAKAGGLVDEIAVLEDLTATVFKGMRVHRYRTKRSLVDDIGLKEMVAQVVADIQAPQLQ